MFTARIIPIIRGQGFRTHAEMHTVIIDRKLVSRPGSSLHISSALDDAGGVGPPRNIPDIPSSVRLASAADSSPIYTTNFWEGTLVAFAGRSEVFLIFNAGGTAALPAKAIAGQTKSRKSSLEGAAMTQCPTRMPSSAAMAHPAATPASTLATSPVINKKPLPPTAIAR